MTKGIHRKTPGRSSSPFFAVQCGSLAEEELEAELLGEEGGSTTSAASVRRGALELAEGGTVFLDEIADMSVGSQDKMLEVLGNAAFKRIGGTREMGRNVRVVASTNRDLSILRETGAFRLGLHRRLSAFHVRLPALRERATALHERRRDDALHPIPFLGKPGASNGPSRGSLGTRSRING